MATVFLNSSEKGQDSKDRKEKKEDNIQFEYHSTIPNSVVTLQTRSGSKPKLNLALFQLYALYRNTVYDSYKQKTNLAQDIKQYNKVFQEKTSDKLVSDPLYHDPLYHYSVAASLSTMKEWKELEGKMQCYIAYQTEKNQKSTGFHKKKVGFVHFIEKEVNHKPMVYISQAGVSLRGIGIGRRLMECVLGSYPAGTEFYIVTRVFNTNAIDLYEKRLHFNPIEKDEIEALGFNERYCGFRYVTTQSDIDTIKNKQMIISICASRVEKGIGDSKTKSSDDRGKTNRMT